MVLLIGPLEVITLKPGKYSTPSSCGIPIRVPVVDETQLEERGVYAFHSCEYLLVHIEKLGASKGVLFLKSDSKASP